MALNLIFPPSSSTIVTPARHKNHIHSSICSLKSSSGHSFNQLRLKKSPKTHPISRDCPTKKPFNFICGDGTDANPLEDEDTVVLDYSDDARFEDFSSPWEGAIIYKRYPSVSHLEYCTTLERLGMEHVSSEVSKSKASSMGLRVTKAVKDYPLGTPVQISIDVTNKKHKLRLDGLIKTVLSLRCLRCGEPAAKSLFLDLALLLDEQPIEESDVIDMEDIFGKDKSKATRFNAEEDYEDDDIDPDFHLYFPSEEKEIDISKMIRDLVHVEITIDALCDSGCKGICGGCGVDLNTSSCICSDQVEEAEGEIEGKNLGPLRDLKNRLQMK